MPASDNIVLDPKRKLYALPRKGYCNLRVQTPDGGPVVLTPGPLGIDNFPGDWRPAAPVPPEPDVSALPPLPFNLMPDNIPVVTDFTPPDSPTNPSHNITVNFVDRVFHVEPGYKGYIARPMNSGYVQVSDTYASIPGEWKKQV